MSISVPRLGSMRVEQLQQACDRFQLGHLEDATPTLSGMGGQNLFVRTTRGDYVLRGNPLFPGQFARERYFTTILHDRTTLPFPHPYLHVPSPEIFGWEYAIMPRLSGISLSDPAIAPSLTRSDLLAITRVLSETLAMIHQIDMPYAGDYDPEIDTVAPLDGPVSARERRMVRTLVEWAGTRTGQVEKEDTDWIEDMMERWSPALDTPFQPTVLLHDYQVGNMLFARDEAGWTVTGIFDLAEAYVGDGESDLTRTLTGLLRGNETELARLFLHRYIRLKPARPGLQDRLSMYSLASLILEWGRNVDSQQPPLRTFVNDRLARLAAAVEPT